MSYGCRVEAGVSKDLQFYLAMQTETLNNKICSVSSATNILPPHRCDVLGFGSTSCLFPRYLWYENAELLIGNFPFILAPQLLISYQNAWLKASLL